MLTYPQNFVSRFSPMADGTMAVPARHVTPYLSTMGKPGRIPSDPVLLGGPSRQVAEDLRDMSSHLMAQATVSAFLDDGLP